MGDDKKEPTVVWSDEVATKAAADPKLAAALRDMGATFRQAMAGVASGQYASFDDAMFALTGSRPERVLPDDEE